MFTRMRLRYLAVIYVLFTSLMITAQKSDTIIIDKVVGVVGKSIIQYSDVEEQYLQTLAQGISETENMKCEIFEDLLAQKLMVTQAAVDSLEVTEVDVEMELERRIQYFVGQIGTEEKLVEYFDKSILEIKEDMRDAVRDQLLMQMMQGEIVKDISITPREVREFYYNLPEDSLPFVESEVEINQIVIYPKSGEEAVFEVKDRLLGLRERIINGENFATLAVLYSEGPSASKGGELGWTAKADLDPAYVKAATGLKKGQVSKIVETSFGYHLIKLEDKTEDRIKTRHIIMKPKISTEAKLEAQNKLDSLITLIRLDSMKFEQAAMYFSQDPDTRLNGGQRINPYTGTTKFQFDQFDTKEYYIIRNMDVGEISDPYESTDDKGKTVYKVIKIKSKTNPHKANLKQDFNMLKQMALQKKQSEIIDKWIEEKLKSTYVRLEEPYNNCNWRIKGWAK